MRGPVSALWGSWRIQLREREGMADEFWQGKELLGAERGADPSAAISEMFSERLHIGSVLDG